jgi:hypothetical protein
MRVVSRQFSLQDGNEANERKNLCRLLATVVLGGGWAQAQQTGKVYRIGSLSFQARRRDG